MTLEELIERAKNGERIGTGERQLTALVDHVRILERDHEQLLESVQFAHRLIEGLQRKAVAFDWLCENLNALDYWAVMRTGRHDVLAAVESAMKEET